MGQCGLVSGEKVVVITSIFFENPVGGFLRLRMMGKKKRKRKVNFCLKMSGKRWYFESVDYCLLYIWIDNKSFGQLGELTSILFKDFVLSIGLSRDPRKYCGAGGGHYFLGGHSLLLIFCY